MTTVAALAAEGKVWMAADSTMIFEWEQRNRGTPKVEQVGDLLIGAAGSGTLGEAVRHRLELPAQADGQSDEAYLNVTVADALRQVVKQCHLQSNDNPRHFNGTLLIGFHGRIYRMSCDYVASLMSDGYDAIGSGADYALGALRILSAQAGLEPEAIVRQSVETSKFFDMGTGGEIVCCSL